MVSMKYLSDEISSYCNFSTTEELIKIGEGSLETKLENLISLGYIGIGRHTFRENKVSSSQYFIFKEGKILAIILEKDIASSSPEYSFLNKPILRGGVLEILTGSRVILESIIKSLNGSSPSINMQEKAGREPSEPLLSEDREDLDREAILKKFNMKEPDEDFAEQVLEEYKSNGTISKAKFEAALLTIRSDLAKIVGEKKARKIIQNKVDALGINIEKADFDDLEELINITIGNLFKTMLGDAKARKAEKALMVKIRDIIS